MYHGVPEPAYQSQPSTDFKVAPTPFSQNFLVKKGGGGKGGGGHVGRPVEAAFFESIKDAPSQSPPFATCGVAIEAVLRTWRAKPKRWSTTIIIRKVIGERGLNIFSSKP